MSTHVLDASGGRPLSLTINDPSRTAASVSAKAGDDVSATISGGREIRLELPLNARIQRRSYPQRKLVYEADQKSPKKDDKGEYVYEDAPPTEHLMLVLPGSTVLFLRTSNELFADDDPAKPSYEGHPHTNIQVRRQKEPHFTESGTLITEVEVSAIGRVLDEAIDGPLIA